MEVAYIFDDKKLKTGAHHINRLIVEKLRERNVDVANYYPRLKQDNEMIRFKGLKNILFFYSLIEQKRQILRADIIQGTTYTPLSFLGFGIPVICHFGSTSWGMVHSTPQTHRIEESCKSIIYDLRQAGVISQVNIKNRRPMRDIAEVELYTGLLADAVIATSQIVKDELIEHGLPEEKIHIIHNAIEDYWFASAPAFAERPALIFLGRIGNDVFNFKLKGIDRVISIYRSFPQLEKMSIVSTDDEKLPAWMDSSIPHHASYQNLGKEDVVAKLSVQGGSFVLLTSRYEGFSLSLIEAMSQGLIPVAYPVGIVPEIIENGRNGFVVNSLREARSVIRRLQDNIEKRKEISQAARKTAFQFQGNIMAEELDNLYQLILGHKQGSEAELLESPAIPGSDAGSDKIANALAIVKQDESRPLQKKKKLLSGKKQ